MSNLPAAPGSGSSAEAPSRPRAGHVALAIGLLATCVTTSVLSSADDPFSARVNLRDAGGAQAWLCVNHARVHLAADDSGHARLVPGHRVTVGVDEASPGAAHCAATTSFVPQAGQSYRAELASARGMCALTIWREVKSNRLGLGVEPSEAPADTCRS